jgi:hypothetical protein
MKTIVSSLSTLCVSLACLLPALAQAPGDLRVALVIGNGAYAGSAALPNPANDAKAMGETLRGLGFTVVEARDASRAQMSEAIGKVRDSLRGKQGVGMLYYAGHGLQVDWRNYMVPVDAKITKPADVLEQTVELGQVIEAFKAAGNRMNIVVLDACRDNPFAGSSAKGLAQLDAPPGTFLAYATAPGNVAEDGAVGQNGLYTSFLLQELKKPQAKIEDVFKRVRLQVRQKSEGRQVPWESTSLEDDFFFNSGVKAAVQQSSGERERAFNDEKAEWDKIKESAKVEDFYAFLQKYPSGSISTLALHRVEKLQADKTVVVADQSGLKGRSFFNSARAGDTFRFEVKDGPGGVSRGFVNITMRQLGEDMFEGVSDAPQIWGSATINSAGALVADSAGGKYDPPMVVVPGGDLKVGNKDRSRSIRIAANGRSWIEAESRVLGRERLKTAFGEIDTFKMEWVQTRQDGAFIKNTLWYDPEWVYAIRFVREFRPRSGPTELIVRDMVSRKRGG